MLSLLLFEHFNLSSLSVIIFDLESHIESYTVNSHYIHRLKKAKHSKLMHLIFNGLLAL